MSIESEPRREDVEGEAAYKKYAFYMPASPQSVHRVDYEYNEDGSVKAATFHFENSGDTPGEWIVQDDRELPTEGHGGST